MQVFSIFLWIFANIHGTLQQFPTDSDELTMTAVESLSTNIEVTCGFNENVGPVLWVINESIYDLDMSGFPNVQLDSIYTLRIPIVLLCFNNTTFQCLSSTIHPPGRVTRIYVEEGREQILYNIANIV